MYGRILIVVVLSCAMVCVPACEQCTCGKEPAADTQRQTEAAPSISWNQLKSGMDAVEVLSLLDQPVDIKATKINTTWYYSSRAPEGPCVIFDTRSMRVDRWRAPSK